MRLMFLTLLDFDTFSERNIYTDLLREFTKNGHEVYCISPVERRRGVKTHFEEHGHLLKLRIGNTQKTNIIEKGISTLLIEPMFKSALKKYFSDIKFDLVLYSTPPITLKSSVEFIKKRDGAKSYLMLKDIFPQNAVDIGMMSKSGVKGLLYKFFRNKEKRLYSLSDYIGCMSAANMDYLLSHNPEITADSVGLCPNSIEPVDMSLSQYEINQMRIHYGIPLNKKVFVYGGNLGKPQGISYIIECLRSQKNNPDVFFLIVGDGTEYDKLSDFVEDEKPLNVKLINRLPKDDYDKMIAACDVGMIFLDHRFTIPNFPSRLLSYMQARLPVFAVTDTNTDIGKIVEDGDFGWWCESNDVTKFSELITEIASKDITEYKKNSWEYLCDNFSVSRVYSDYLKPILYRFYNN